MLSHMTAMNPPDAPSEPTQHETAPPAPAVTVLLDDVVDNSQSTQADCCIAPAAYCVVLPPSSSRAHTATLWLCGHHLRASSDALAAAHASIFDEHHRLIASPALGGTGVTRATAPPPPR